ncbi:hypothetical protein SAMN05216319_2959 [Duganella sp. CF402]|uniref:TFIIB-type zinc ribbon-containing protein n=1 Tax=unclassified Duganella TaxID=2636909 RepID=UPI0008BA56C5|nr:MULTISPECIES: zf-TFIIB domain-containing protein [unclassified Duganella]RZT08626.1 hypothetical protein EV582_0661 [Duganella sp. BK701]SEL87371.1 hypothetical protein SAMN05216319_2959 [Duganella sp. CF402]
MLCPVDHSELLMDSVDGYQVHRCVQCSGVALSGKLLRDVHAYAALKMHKQQGGVADVGPCPADSQAMMTLDYKGVAMCACPQCLNLWLSHDQWVRLLDMVGPPKQTDLSGVVPGLAATQGTFGLSSPDAFNTLDGIGDILELSAEIIEAIGKLTD